MKGFCRFVGFLNLIAAIVCFVLWFTTKFNYVFIIVAVASLLDGLLFLYLGGLGYDVESLQEEATFLRGQINALNKEINYLKEKLSSQKEDTARIEKEVIKEKKIREQASDPEEPIEEKIPQVIRLKSSDIVVESSSLSIKGQKYDIKKVSNLAAVGNELRFFIDENKYIIECSYYSESSKIYDDIHAHVEP